MFFNHLLSLTTLKNRLLNATSFSQVYSQEKLPLKKFRKEGAMLSPLIAGLLAACGGGDGVNWVGQDNDDTITGFERGVDKLVLIDMHDNPISDLSTFNAQIIGDDTIFDSADDELRITLQDPDSDDDYESLVLTFAGGGSTLTLNFATPVDFYDASTYLNLEDLLDGTVEGGFDGLELTSSLDIV